ncbi:MAG: FkbM family methyltransferase [Planctomycetia bacterium]|nr:FkbM family methyltransferase [Planctomycetia bacterium]
MVHRQARQLLQRTFGRSATLRHWYRVMRDGAFRSTAPRPTPYGFRLTGHEAMMAGTFEPGETALMQGLLAGTEIFVNVGANVGYYVCHALHAGCHAVAFEPLRSNADYLMRNIAANGWDERAEVFPIAISDRPGIVELFGAGTGASLIPGWAGAPMSGGQLTPANTLDNVLAGRCRGKRCLILMDVEGFEDKAVAGAVLLLRQEPRPTWVVEIQEPRAAWLKELDGRGAEEVINPNFESTFRRFWDQGYEAWAFCEPTARVSPETVSMIMETGRNPFPTNMFRFDVPG